MSHPAPVITARRQFLQTTGLSLLSLPVMGQQAGSKTATATKPSAAPIPDLEPLNRFPRMMQEWLLDQVEAAEDLGNARRDALKTKADAEAYVKSVQERIRQAFGPLPEKTPLNARVTGTVEREGYRIENILFESRPGYLVTGNLYLPTGRAGKVPATVGVCGHSINGKAAEAYQSFAQGLARLGHICFIIDPVGQGERFQYLKDGSLKSRLGGGVSEHIQMGNAQTLVGEFLGTWFAWDGIRALDYLLTREEVDTRHLGVTGNSGGGTQTTWLCGLEPRFTMGAPSCFITTFRRNVENELPADTEQCPSQVLALGLDHCDFLAAMAPKPVIIMAQEKDFFDARGSAEAYERLKKLYTLLGKPENIRLHVGPDPHGYSQSNREAMYRFFNAAVGYPEVAAEPALMIEKDEVLQCTPDGQVAKLGSRTLMDFTKQKAEALAAKRKPLSGQALKQAVREILRLPDLPESAPDYGILRSVGSRKYPSQAYCTYTVETESGIRALVTRLQEEALTSRMPGSAKRAILYISHHSADIEIRQEPLVQELIQKEPDAAFYACDVRGIGESQPNTCGADQFLKPYGSHYFYAAHGLMLDRPLLGQRVFDVLRVIQALRAAGHQEVHLAGRGWGALTAALAALFATDVKQVTLKNALSSFQEIAVDAEYQWPYAVMLPGVLGRWDVPECYQELKSKGLVSSHPWSSKDGMSL